MQVWLGSTSTDPSETPFRKNSYVPLGVSQVVLRISKVIESMVAGGGGVAETHNSESPGGGGGSDENVDLSGEYGVRVGGGAESLPREGAARV